MKVKDLQALLATCDPEATVVVAGFETVATEWVAEADLVSPCKIVVQPEDAMSGNRKLKSDGETAVWIGWSKDYRTKSFLDAVANPEVYGSD